MSGRLCIRKSIGGSSFKSLWIRKQLPVESPADEILLNEFLKDRFRK